MASTTSLPKVGARSLQAMALSKALNHHLNVTDIGVVPYDLVAPLIAKITFPEQLHTLELNSPQIIGHTAGNWRKMIERDIPQGLATLAQFNGGKGEPNNPANWYKLYKKLKRDAENKQRENLAAMKLKLENTVGANGRTVAKDVGAAGTEGDMTFRNTAPPRRSDMRGGKRTGEYVPVHRKGFFDRIKHERTKDALAKQYGKARTPLSKEKARLQVSRAPALMVMDVKEEQKREQMRKEGEAIAVRGPRKRMASKPLFGPEASKVVMKRKEAAYDLAVDRENRLRALKAGKALPKPTNDPGLTEDFLEGDDEISDDKELFGEAVVKSNNHRGVKQELVEDVDQLLDDEMFDDDGGPATAMTPTKPPAGAVKRTSPPLSRGYSPPNRVVKRKAPASLFIESRRGRR